ncbi:MAG TPA: hypothetical protein VMI32_00290 [Candidatus Solibacter sp.]|nr:hypothetical protein [Candidatus Solibacter sp.]
MRAETIPRSASHHAKPLVIRGGLARTFGGLISFLALLFLLLGLYILREAFAHPLDAQAIGVLAAATSITLAAILFYFLLKPKHKHGPGSRTTYFRRAG